MKEPKIETTDEGTAEWSYLRQNYLDGLMEAFILTNDYSKLRKYIEEGGDIDAGRTDTFDLRKIIVEIMDPDFSENPKGSKDAEMVFFYLAVCEKLLSQNYQHPNKRNTIRAATKFVAENHKPHPIEFKTAENRYAEGRKRFIEKFGKPWTET